MGGVGNTVEHHASRGEVLSNPDLDDGHVVELRKKCIGLARILELCNPCSDDALPKEARDLFNRALDAYDKACNNDTHPRKPEDEDVNVRMPHQWQEYAHYSATDSALNNLLKELEIILPALVPPAIPPAAKAAAGAAGTGTVLTILQRAAGFFLVIPTDLLIRCAPGKPVGPMS